MVADYDHIELAKMVLIKTSSTSNKKRPVHWFEQVVLLLKQLFSLEKSISYSLLKAQI
jgi:hypothetical protein